MCQWGEVNVGLCLLKLLALSVKLPKLMLKKSYDSMWCHKASMKQIFINSLRLRQSGRHFADDIFKCISLNENVWIPIKISLKYVPKGPINNIPSLVQIMAWRRPGDKPLSEPMVVSLLTHICVTRPQWVYDMLKKYIGIYFLSMVKSRISIDIFHRLHLR